MFSGRRDPTWTIPSSHPNYNRIKNHMAKSPTLSPENMPARLGYKGFTVREESGREQLILGQSTRALQHLLLSTMPAGELLKENIEEVQRDIDKLDIHHALGSTASSVSSQDSKKRRCNNCYNYANDILTDTYSQPGLASGQVFSDYKGTSLVSAAQLDGLKTVPEEQVFRSYKGTSLGSTSKLCKHKKYTLALAIDQGELFDVSTYSLKRFLLVSKYRVTLIKQNVKIYVPNSIKDCFGNGSLAIGYWMFRTRNLFQW